MFIARCLTTIVLSSVFAQSIAQESAIPRDPSDASVSEADFRYESVFAGYLPAVESSDMPSNAWRAANEEMAKLGGHAGHIKNSANSGAGSASTAGSTRPATMLHDSAPKAVEHGGHGMHH